MAVDTKHPKYAEFLLDWRTMRDTYKGARHIKEAGETYLPSTSGMQQDGMGVNQAGWKVYQAYKQRAVFYDFVSTAVEHMMGMLHSSPSVIELPERLEPLRERATLYGESLEQLLRRINEEQLVTGRVGLLLDLEREPDQVLPLPYFVTYSAESIINWDDGAIEELSKPVLNLIVLDESEYTRKDDFSWDYVRKHRALVLGKLGPNEPFGVYTNKLLIDGEAYSTTAERDRPTILGVGLYEIPFVFINTKDLVSDPDAPPLLGLAQQALTIYRGEADYRQNLFMQGQDTLVVTGSTEDVFRVGAGSTLVLPTGGDAKYVGVNSAGLAEQRQALENDKAAALSKIISLTDTRSRDKESGAALRIRLAAQTAGLHQIALTGAAGLERLLKVAARWVGADPEEVRVVPNLDFMNEDLTGRTLVEYMSAKSMGAPLSLKSIHDLMRARSLTEKDYEEEVEEILNEAPLVSGAGA